MFERLSRLEAIQVYETVRLFNGDLVKRAMRTVIVQTKRVNEKRDKYIYALCQKHACAVHIFAPIDVFCGQATANSDD